MSFTFYRTALQLMVESKKFDCIIALLSRGADTNIQDSDGNTALHLAVQISDNIHVLQSLIIFGADLNILNHDGESSRHLLGKIGDPQALYCLHAVGAKRCAMGTVNCNDCCYVYGTDDGERPPVVNEYTNLETINNMLDVAGMEMVSNKYEKGIPRKGRLLSLDGGGIRGLILIQMLLELENIIGKYNYTYFFVIIGGTYLYKPFFCLIFLYIGIYLSIDALSDSILSNRICKSIALVTVITLHLYSFNSSISIFKVFLANTRMYKIQ